MPLFTVRVTVTRPAPSTWERVWDSFSSSAARSNCSSWPEAPLWAGSSFPVGHSSSKTPTASTSSTYLYLSSSFHSCSGFH